MHLHIPLLRQCRVCILLGKVLRIHSEEKQVESFTGGYGGIQQNLSAYHSTQLVECSNSLVDLHFFLALFSYALMFNGCVRLHYNDDEDAKIA